MKEKEILEKKEIRENMIDRIEVLEKVKELLLLGNSHFATTQQVADYYEVGYEAIKSLVKDNREELINNGLKNLTGKETKEILVKSLKNLTNHKGYFEAEGQKFANRSNLLFQKRTILNVGMLLRDSKVAKEVRSRLLDIEYESNNSIQDNGQTLKQNILNEIRTEQDITKELVQAMCEGDYVRESQLKTELIGLKSKRIVELEETNKVITENSLTIKDSRLVINRIARYISDKRYHNNFKACWKYIWTLANYKLNINIRKRTKDKNQRYLIDLLNNEELKQLELMCKNWVIELGYNLNEIIKLC
ncbi:hypothetical protein DVV91_17035 [Clostridium botulinum]|uniref:hypothetical protein n=1 Tax=Clostridium botulinum TaxID=1491 RepID=UPI00196708A5|nr:hypothetical protein [Clostridium botulinum]MBN1076028.1 hypothetical protein [Clostridium botulinum]